MAWWRIAFYSYITFSARGHPEYWKWGFTEKQITFGWFYEWDRHIVQSRMLLGQASTDFSTSDLSKLMTFFFIFQSPFFIVQCFSKVSKVQVKLYLWMLSCKRDGGTLQLTDGLILHLYHSSLCFQGIFMHIILFDLHNNQWYGELLVSLTTMAQ